MSVAKTSFAPIKFLASPPQVWISRIRSKICEVKSAKSIIQMLILFAIAFATTGCAPCCLNIGIPGDGDTVHHLILGIGIVSVPAESEPDSIMATKVQALGLSISNQPGLKLGLGYSSSSVVTVSDGAEDVRVEVSDQVGGPVVIDAQKVKFQRE